MDGGREVSWVKSCLLTYSSMYLLPIYPPVSSLDEKPDEADTRLVRLATELSGTSRAVQTTNLASQQYRQ